MSVQPQNALVAGRRLALHAENIACIERCLSLERQAEIWQVLRNENTQARIVDREPSVERVNGEQRRFG